MCWLYAHVGSTPITRTLYAISHVVAQQVFQYNYSMGKTKYTKDILQAAVLNATSLAQVLTKLGLRPAGGNYTHIQKKLRQHNIDTSHFLGQGWNLGNVPSNKLSWEDVLIYGRYNNKRREDSWRLRRALIEMGRPYRCAICKTMAGGRVRK